MGNFIEILKFVNSLSLSDRKSKIVKQNSGHLFNFLLS